MGELEARELAVERRDQVRRPVPEELDIGVLDRGLRKDRSSGAVYFSGPQLSGIVLGDLDRDLELGPDESKAESTDDLGAVHGVGDDSVA